MRDVALTVLVRGGKNYLPAAKLGGIFDKRKAILKLVAEAVCSAHLIKPRARHKARIVRLIRKKPIYGKIEKRAFRLDFYVFKYRCCAHTLRARPRKIFKILSCMLRRDSAEVKAYLALSLFKSSFCGGKTFSAANPAERSKLRLVEYKICLTSAGRR